MVGFGRMTTFALAAGRSKPKRSEMLLSVGRKLRVGIELLGLYSADGAGVKSFFQHC